MSASSMVGGLAPGEIQVLPAREDVVASYRSQLLDLFCEPRFFFKTFRPRTLGERAALALVTREQTQLIVRRGELIGLWEASYVNYAGMIYNVDFRVRDPFDPATRARLLDDLLAPFMAHRPVSNLLHATLELDEEGIATFSRSRWFEHIGDLGSYGIHGGGRQAMTYFVLAPGTR